MDGYDLGLQDIVTTADTDVDKERFSYYLKEEDISSCLFGLKFG